MNKQNDNITSTEIENAIIQAGDSFSAAQVVDSLASADTESLRKRVERFIAADEEIFYDEKWQCRTRKGFFNGRKFLITPDDWEINAGILFPGHRFVPFISEAVFPSTITLSENGKNAEMKKIILPLGTAFHYHILLGSEQIFDFIMADDPANEVLKKGASRTDSVTLSVFDMAEFYRKNEFLFGDALLCTVTDYEAGKVSFEYLSGSVRGAQARKNYFKTMDDAAEKVWNTFQDYLDIPAQLAWMNYYAGTDAAELPGASLDEFIAGSEKVQLRPEGDHAVLTIRSADDHEHGDDCSCGCHDDNEMVDLPDGLSISSGDLADPFKLLAKAGVPLNSCELDGFMLDAIYGRETDFSGVQSRIFGSAELDLPDEAQQAVLLNFLEERFEVMLENYNRADDETKAELRSQIMEAVSRRLDYISLLGASGRDPDDKEKEKIRRLADVSAKLDEALKLINNPGFIPDRQEKENLEILIDDQLAIQEDILSDYSTEADQ
ncbi:MAG: hypothetical protein J6W00_07185 [Lentisphaeria bacterium]|nr:hypothetical protein [Lentisphaeria bacterium]